MATRKEERERLRQIRREAEAREAREQRRRLILGYAVAGVLGAAVVAGVVAVILAGSGDASGEAHIFAPSGNTNGVPTDDRTGIEPPPAKVADLRTAARQAGCDLRMNLRDEGHSHIPAGSPTPNYGTNPPTSGPHVETGFHQADGAYREMPAPIDFVHSLEHGRLEIQYSPDLRERDQLVLKGLYDTMFSGTLLFPNGEMPYEVAATTWQHLLGCDSYRGSITLDAIRAFGRATWGRFGGEAAPIASGPNPAAPSS
jgi:Protein of unknown function (DUF3105)